MDAQKETCDLRSRADGIQAAWRKPGLGRSKTLEKCAGKRRAQSGLRLPCKERSHGDFVSAFFTDLLKTKTCFHFEKHVTALPSG